MRSVLLTLFVFAVAACGAEDRTSREQAVARTELARAETVATAAALIPSTGLWTEAHLAERLVRAGVAPRPMVDPPAGLEWMRQRPFAFHAGGGTVVAWIYADSIERKAVTDSLDPSTAAPAGRTPPFEGSVVLVVQNNLAAVVTGGSEQNQERIALALQGGLPVTVAPSGAGTRRTP